MGNMRTCRGNKDCVFAYICVGSKPKKKEKKTVQKQVS